LDVFQKAKECNYSDAGGWFKIGMTLYDGKYYQEALDAFERVQVHGKADPSHISAAIVWQGHLLDLLGQREKAIACYKKALEQSGTLNMRHDQYKMRLNRQWVEKRLEEPFRRE
jgi:tetratricopeptide (TPR) repeat protein